MCWFICKLPVDFNWVIDCAKWSSRYSYSMSTLASRFTVGLLNDVCICVAGLSSSYAWSINAYIVRVVPNRHNFILLPKHLAVRLSKTVVQLSTQSVEAQGTSSKPLLYPIIETNRFPPFFRFGVSWSSWRTVGQSDYFPHSFAVVFPYHGWEIALKSLDHFAHEHRWPKLKLRWVSPLISHVAFLKIATFLWSLSIAVVGQPICISFKSDKISVPICNDIFM